MSFFDVMILSDLETLLVDDFVMFCYNPGTLSFGVFSFHVPFKFRRVIKTRHFNSTEAHVWCDKRITIIH